MFLRPALCLILGLVVQHGASGADKPDASSRPPSIFVDRGACPFECCTYRRWTANTAITLWDRPKGTRVVGSLDKGQIVQGLTGEVWSTPFPLKSDRDIPETAIKAGDTFYVLHYEGEGNWKVWFRGAVISVNDIVVNIPNPQPEWWVKVKDKGENIGWAISQRNFDHQDACE